jgi:hypothetical protein
MVHQITLLDHRVPAVNNMLIHILKSMEPRPNQLTCLSVLKVQDILVIKMCIGNDPNITKHVYTTNLTGSY